MKIKFSFKADQIKKSKLKTEKLEIGTNIEDCITQLILKLMGENINYLLNDIENVQEKKHYLFILCHKINSILLEI